MSDDLDAALSAVGPRLRTLRRQRETTLADLSAQTGVSVSTLSAPVSLLQRGGSGPAGGAR